jgi:4-hydroxybenzoyl-CoA thioesterase
MNAMNPFESSKPIRFHHCDPAGIVFYPEYFVLFNELVEDWFNEGLGIDFARYHTVGRRGVPAVHVECDFVQPSQVGEMLRMRLSVKKVGTSSLTLAIEAGVGEAVRVRATLVVVHASLDTLRAVPFTPEFRAKLARYQA